MNPNDMTAQEAADWCAAEYGYGPVCGQYGTERWASTPDGETYTVPDPFPLTLDGADAAVPPGWDWSRASGVWNGWHEECRPGCKWVEPATPDTGDKIGDLFRLAVACRMAGKEQA